jgi:HlyD family secretion protein
VKVDNAEVTLTDARKNLVDKLNDAFVKSDDAIRAKVDQFITNPRAQNPKLNFQVDSQLAAKIESTRLALEGTLTLWQTSLVNLTISSDLLTYLASASDNLFVINNFLNDVSFVVNALQASASLTQTTIDSYKADILTARTNINTAISNLTTAGEKLRAADSNLRLENNNLKLSLAGATAGDLEAAEASLKSSEANVLNLKSQLAKTVIRAPFAGVVSVQDAKVGEIATAGKILVSLFGSTLHIEAYVPEADVAKIHLKDQARVTLDAYSSEIEFPAEVVFMDPAETVIENVSTYRILLEFKTEDERIRSGMTANLDIITATKEKALAVPQRAVIGQNGGSFVKVLVGNEIVNKDVKIGIRSNDGLVEVISGLEVGDTVIIN